MSFEPARPISVVVCEQCRGAGCDQCDRLGVYALKDDQPIGFNLPDFIDLKTRKFLKRIFLIKRFILLAAAALIILTLYAFSR